MLQGNRKGKKIPAGRTQKAQFILEQSKDKALFGWKLSLTQKPGVAIQPVSRGAVHLNPFFNARNSPTLMGVFCFQVSEKALTRSP